MTSSPASRASGWATTRVDGHDPAAIAAAIEQARRSDRPSLIACKTIIGFGAPTKQGTAATHGEALGAEEIEGARAKLAWTSAPFEVPEAILAAWRSAGTRGAAERAEWERRAAEARAPPRRLARRSDRRGGGAAPSPRPLPQSRPSSSRRRRRSPPAWPRRRCWRSSSPRCPA